MKARKQEQVVLGVLCGVSEFLHYTAITEKAQKFHSFFGPTPQFTVHRILRHLRVKGIVEQRESRSGYYRLIKRNNGLQGLLF